MVTAFQGSRKLISGELADVAPAVKTAQEDDSFHAILVFNDETGTQVDLDLRGTADEIQSRYTPGAPPKAGPGRPKLGVVAREVTLLPRHWEWLAKQPGGASVALRKLVEEASKTLVEIDTTRESRETTYRFISVLAGNLPNFEEATRALYAGDQLKFREQISVWPMDVQIYALGLAGKAWS
jgi:uncharacterized protein